MVKCVKNITGIGLKEAMAAISNLPYTVKDNASKEEAESIKQQLLDNDAEIVVIE